MIGIILCGGESKRMGTDKGLLKVPGSTGQLKTWVELAVDNMKTLFVPVKISVNKKQLADYSKLFNSNDLVADNPLLKIKGPLCGLLSSHLEYPSEDILVLACDMPMMEPEILKELMEQYQQHAGSETYIFSNNGEPEPLCGIYSRKALAHIYQLYKKDLLFKHSMKFILAELTSFLIPLPDQKKKYFSNFNSHAELKDSQT